MKKKKIIYKLITLLLITLSIPISIYLLDRRTHFINRAYFSLTGNEANLVINLTDSRPFVPHWGYFAQGGEERDGMLSDVIKPVSIIEPVYIRIDHVYDFYDVVKRGSGGKLEFNWSQLDKELNVILQTGAKPFVSLSYMPSAISSGSEVDTPYSWDEWKQVVQRTIEHVSGKNELAITDVYYEVWNEPDLFGGYKLKGSKNYLTMYLYAERASRDARNTYTFKFGGPATTGLYKSWFDNLLIFAAKNNLRVDFFSWHLYSKNIADFEKDIFNAKVWLLNHPKYASTEFIISESGFNSENDSLYDSDFSAIHTLSMYAATFQKIGKILVFELKDGPGPEKFWGRWGILTHENFGNPTPKPRYKALEFLNLMRGNWYPVYGQGSWVKAFATTDGSSIKLLVVNYDPYSKHVENIPITFVNMPVTSFTFRRTDFLGKTTNMQNTTSDKNWKTMLFMQPNTASILEIIPQ